MPRSTPGGKTQVRRTMPKFTEIKHRIDGPTSTFECKLIHWEPDHVIIRYDIGGHETWEVAGIQLPPGTITYAYYWTNRPYNVYHWVLPDGTTAGYYFNLADETRIGKDRVEWRDLVVDILVTPEGHYQVLDEEELPATLAPSIRAELEQAKAEIAHNWQQIVARIAQKTEELRERKAGSPENEESCSDD